MSEKRLPFLAGVMFPAITQTIFWSENASRDGIDSSISNSLGWSDIGRTIAAMTPYDLKRAERIAEEMQERAHSASEQGLIHLIQLSVDNVSLLKKLTVELEEGPEYIKGRNRRGKIHPDRCSQCLAWRQGIP